MLDRERESGDVNADAMGVTIIESRGIRHRIEFRVDHVNNQPKIAHTTTPCDRKVGTKITIEWPTSEALLQYAEHRFKFLTQSYVFFNPHLTLRGVWHCAAHGKAIADRDDSDIRLVQFFDQCHVTKDVGVAHVIERLVIGEMEHEAGRIAEIDILPVFHTE